MQTEGAGLVQVRGQRPEEIRAGTRYGPSPASGIGTVQGWRRS
jgi:hypothetical protein